MKTLTIPASWNNPWQDGWNDPTNPRPAYVPNSTPLGSGPYKAILATEPGAEELVAYYPADLVALGRFAAARPPFLPPFRDGARFTFFPRPEPLFFPPPVSSFTVAQARRAASFGETPRFS